jgi:hypothetical protein
MVYALLCWLYEQVLSSCLKITLVDYKGVNVKLLKLTGKAQAPATLYKRLSLHQVTQSLTLVVHTIGSGSNHPPNTTSPAA